MVDSDAGVLAFLFGGVTCTYDGKAAVVQAFLEEIDADPVRV